jgi:hypothetical protein
MAVSISIHKKREDFWLGFARKAQEAGLAIFNNFMFG